MAVQKYEMILAGVRYLTEKAEGPLCEGCVFNPGDNACPLVESRCNCTNYEDTEWRIWVKAEDQTNIEFNNRVTTIL
jgi:hypothetical protein